jgi:hypothetical protein
MKPGIVDVGRSVVVEVLLVWLEEKGGWVVGWEIKEDCDDDAGAVSEGGALPFVLLFALSRCLGTCWKLHLFPKWQKPFWKYLHNCESFLPFFGA